MHRASSDLVSSLENIHRRSVEPDRTQLWRAFRRSITVYHYNNNLMSKKLIFSFLLRWFAWFKHVEDFTFTSLQGITQCTTTKHLHTLSSCSLTPAPPRRQSLWDHQDAPQTAEISVFQLLSAGAPIIRPTKIKTQLVFLYWNSVWKWFSWYNLGTNLTTWFHVGVWITCCAAHRKQSQSIPTFMPTWTWTSCSWFMLWAI